MLKRSIALIAAVAVLGACQRDPVADEQPRSNQQAARNIPAAQANSAAAASEDQKEAPANRTASTEAGKLPPFDGSLRFVGRWATELPNCKSMAWRFSAKALDTPAGSHCQFNDVQPVPGGYDIMAMCTAEAPPVHDQITLRFAESAQAMLFSSKTIADAGLVYCGK